ncbi:MAG: hypothetical protein WBO07_08440 [Formosimonas sp.]|jgi:hypothetical protein
MHTHTHSFAGFDNPIEIFRAGSHVDAKGVPCEFTQAHLDEMIKNTQPATAPIVIGHPTTDAPAYGWNASLSRDGDVLFAKFDQVNSEFAELVKSGAYKKRSIKAAKNANGEFYVAHVGFLGAAAPAIKGLADVQFAAVDDAQVFEFAQFAQAEAMSEVGYQLQTIGGLFRSMRDKMIETDGVEAADRFFSEWQINTLQNAHESIMSRLSTEPNQFSEADIEHEFSEFILAAARDTLKSEADAIKADAASTAAASEFTETIAQQQATIAALHAEKHLTDCRAKVFGWQTTGHLSPACSAGAAEFMASLSPTQTFEFAEGESNKTMPTADWFASFVERLPAVKLGDEQGHLGAPMPSITQAVDIVAAAHAFTAEQKSAGVDVHWTQAVAHVTRTQT